MTNHQHIFFSRDLDFNPLGGGIVDKHKEVLNLYFHDHNESNRLVLIGKTLEWVPQIWLNFEKEKLSNFKQINLISLLGDLSELKIFCENLFPSVEIKYYQHNLFIQNSVITKSLTHDYSTFEQPVPKKYITRTSLGTMRLNRYVLLRFAYGKNIPIYHPAITDTMKTAFDNEIIRSTGKKLGKFPYTKANRAFDEKSDWFTFNKKYFKILEQSMVNFVATFPNTDFLQDSHDEKYFDSVLAKCIPFVLNAKNSNRRGVKSLGFLPYEGIDIDYDDHENPIVRWQGLLENNIDLLVNKEKAEECYFKNQKIIEYNFDRLIKNDWNNDRLNQYKLLPTQVQDYLKFIK